MKRSLVLFVMALVSVGMGCSSNTTSAAVDRSETTSTSLADGPTDLGRVVALGEEFMLADLLALGVTPVASTATVADVGFQGVEGDTAGIAALPSTEPNLERLAALQPDTIVTTQFVVDELGRERLDALASLVVVPDRLSSPDQLTALGEALGRQSQAAALNSDLARAESAAADAVPDDCSVSLATIYPGPTPAAWVSGPGAAAAALLDVGCALRPSSTTAPPDGNGRAYLSLEQLGLLDGPDLILLQSAAVPGEADAVTAIEANPIWQGLPAVQADRVSRLDRLGYPGVAGQIRLYDEIAALLGA